MNEPLIFADLQDAGNAQAQLLLLAIARHANWDTGECYPGQETLARMAKCTSRTVRSYLSKLESDGLIARSERRKENGARQSELIVLLGYKEWITSARNGGVVAKPKAISKYNAAPDLPEDFSGRCAGILPETPTGKISEPTGKISMPTGRQVSGNKEPSLNSQKNLDARAREGSNFDLKSEGQVQLTKAAHPDQIAAWRRYADLTGGKRNRFIVRMIDDHGACVVPSAYPPDGKTLTEKSKRMAGEAA